jgi:hypothetical protein
MIPKLGPSVLPHIDMVKATCMRLSLEKQSKVQKASFGPLIQLFGLCDTLDADELVALESRLEISKLWNDIADRFLFSRDSEVRVSDFRPCSVSVSCHRLPIQSTKPYFAPFP